MPTKPRSSTVEPAQNLDPRALRSRDALAKALLKLLANTSFDQITIRDIVAEAGIGYTTFFRHHATKEELLDAIAAEQIRCLFSLSMPVMDAYDASAAATALFTYVNANRVLWSTLLTGGAAGAVREEFLGRARAVAAQRGEPDAQVPVDLSTMLLVSGTLEILTWWLRQSQPMPIKRLAEIHVKVVIAPILGTSRGGRARSQR